MSTDWMAEYTGIGKTEEDDGTYQAWRAGGRTDPEIAMSLKLVPAAHTGLPIVHLSYMQCLTIEEHQASNQLCLLCHSSHHVVFLEGEKLGDIAEAISKKQAHSVHQYDPAKHGNLETGAAVVREMKVERRE